MAFQYSATVRNSWLDQIEATIGTAPTLELRTGAIPASYGVAATGTILASLALPSDWMANASGGTKALAGTWAGTAIAAGTAGYFRINGSGGGMQGTVTITGGGGDLVLDNPVIASGQAIAVASFTLTAGGA